MTADLAADCRDLATWLPVIGDLITEPDTTVSTGHVKPGSRPPWNGPVALLWFDVHAGVRDLEQELRHAVTGRNQRRQSWTDAATIAAIGAVSRLAEAAPEADAADASRRITGWITAFLQLPAIDVEERPRKVRSACPYCGLGMLRLLPRSGRVTCLRYGACTDGNGAHPAGELAISSLDGEPRIYWNDGSVT